MKKPKTLRCHVCGIEVEIKINRVENPRSRDEDIGKSHENHERQRRGHSSVCKDQHSQSHSSQDYARREGARSQTIDDILMSLFESERLTERHPIPYEDEISLVLERAEIDGFNEANRVIQGVSTTTLFDNQPIKRFFTEQEELAWECQSCGRVYRGKRVPSYCPTCETPDPAFKQLVLLN